MTIKNNTMVTQDLLPARLRSRKTGHLGYFNIWVGLAVILATFGVGGEAVSLVNMTQMIASHSTASPIPPICAPSSVPKACSA